MWLWLMQVGQRIKDALHAQSAAPVVVELDWKESVLHENDRSALSNAGYSNVAEQCSRHAQLELRIACKSGHQCCDHRRSTLRPVIGRSVSRD